MASPRTFRRLASACIRAQTAPRERPAGVPARRPLQVLTRIPHRPRAQPRRSSRSRWAFRAGRPGPPWRGGSPHRSGQTQTPPPRPLRPQVDGRQPPPPRGAQRRSVGTWRRPRRSRLVCGGEASSIQAASGGANVVSEGAKRGMASWAQITISVNNSSASCSSRPPGSRLPGRMASAVAMPACLAASSSSPTSLMKRISRGSIPMSTAIAR